MSWRRFVRKLRDGRPTNIVVLGSSIASFIYAGCDGHVFNGEQQLVPCTGQHGVGWLRSFGDWLNAVFPISAPRGSSNATAALAGKHTTYALGRTGSGADAFVDCFQTHVKQVRFLPPPPNVVPYDISMHATSALSLHATRRQTVAPARPPSLE